MFTLTHHEVPRDLAPARFSSPGCLVSSCDNVVATAHMPGHACSFLSPVRCALEQVLVVCLTKKLRAHLCLRGRISLPRIRPGMLANNSAIYRQRASVSTWDGH